MLLGACLLLFFGLAVTYVVVTTKNELPVVNELECNKCFKTQLEFKPCVCGNRTFNLKSYGK